MAKNAVGTEKTGNISKDSDAPENSGDQMPIIIIKPRPAWKLLDFKEISQYRDLFYMLVVREIKVRYKQTVLGGLWAILQPLLTMIVFSLFFGGLAKMPSNGSPYPLFSFAAVVPWTYFSNALSSASTSLINNKAFINKVYFPRISIPVAPIFGWLLDFVIAMAVLLAMMAYYQTVPTINSLMLPVLTLIMIFCAAGVGMWLAALTVHYRDFRYIVPFFIQLWMFVSPVVYPSSIIKNKHMLALYALNPMAGVIEGFRSALLGKPVFPWFLVGISVIVSIALLITGLAYFRSLERAFADVA